MKRFKVKKIATILGRAYNIGDVIEFDSNDLEALSLYIDKGVIEEVKDKKESVKDENIQKPN